MEYRIGIDLGGTDIKAGLLDQQYRMVHKLSVPTDAKRGFEAVVADMAALAKEAAAREGLSIGDFDCVGVGTPGCTNPNTGLLVFSNNTDWKNVPLRERLHQHLGVPIFIGNDANCAIIGEAVAGAAKGCKNALLFTLGTGVGGGLIYQGKLFTGADGMGAEFGHMTMVHGGVRCTCGNYGCIESYASVSGLIRQTRESMAAHPASAMHEYTRLKGGKVTGRTAFDCAKQGDEAALEVVDQYIEYVATGLGGYVNVFRPEIVIVGGGISNEGEYLMKPLNEKMQKHVFACDVIGAPPVVAAALGNDAGIIGAAYLNQM